MMKFNRSDFVMIKEAVDFYYNTLWNRLMEVLTNENINWNRPEDIDKIYQEKINKIQKWNNLKEKLK